MALGTPPPGPTFIDQMPLVDVLATGIASDTADTVEPSSNPDAVTSFIRNGRVPSFSILHADADGPITVPSAFTANGTFAGTLNAMFSVSSAYAFRMPIQPKMANRQTTIARIARMLAFAGRRQEAVSDIKEDSRLVGKTGTHRSKIARYRVKYNPRVAESDIRGGMDRRTGVLMYIGRVWFAGDRESTNQECLDTFEYNRVIQLHGYGAAELHGYI